MPARCARSAAATNASRIASISPDESAAGGASCAECARVVVEAEAAVRDAPVARDCGGLDREHAGTRLQQLAPVDEMPIVGAAVVGRVLAHRRHDDAIGQREPAQRERVEEMQALRQRTVTS